MMIKTISMIIINAIASAIIIFIGLNIMGSKIVRKDTVTKTESYPHHRWCYEANGLKPDDFCIEGITYREYQAQSDDPMMNFRLYGVKIGEESRAAVAKGETRILGGEKVPICELAGKYDASFCYNDEKMEAHLVAKDDQGRTVIVWAKDYHDVRKGFRFKIIGDIPN